MPMVPPPPTRGSGASCPGSRVADTKNTMEKRKDKGEVVRSWGGGFRAVGIRH